MSSVVSTSAAPSYEIEFTERTQCALCGSQRDG